MFSSAAIIPRNLFQSSTQMSIRQICSVAGAEVKKGYWINHIVDIKDEAKFSAYLTASMSTFAPGNKYGAKILVSGPVAKTFNGHEKVELATLIEFNSVQAAIDVWEDPDYVVARAEMGDPNDERSVVERRVCVIESSPIMEEIHPGDGFWLNHIEEILDEEKFERYTQSSMPIFPAFHFGSVVHQVSFVVSYLLQVFLRFNDVFVPS